MMGALFHKLFKKKKPLKLEFCQNNLDRFLNHESLSQLNQFFNEVSVSVKEFDCLSHCKLCKEKAYVIVNGKKVIADDESELLEKLRGFRE
jgi:uncharacterized protein YuzB (UPF0349 family)